MLIEIDGEDLFVNGVHFCACRCDLGSGDYKVVVSYRSGISAPYVVGAGVNFTDQENEDGILVAQFIVDGTPINSRATLAKITNKILDEINLLGSVTLEVA
jgi:hypothetical protein